MSDVRALLKAKRQETLVQHPYASYTSTGQLRCTACETIVKQASAWGGHVSSKTHRENVAKERAPQLGGQKAARSIGKRKVEQDNSNDEEVHPAFGPSKKHKVAASNSLSKPTPEHPRTFPVNFFSDSSRIPIPLVDDESSEKGEDNQVIIPQEAVDNPLDLEWQMFREEVLTSESASTQADQPHETFKRATVFAEPELLQEYVSGLPIRKPSQVVVETPQNEGESRKRREEEEKELIMDRLFGEERAQEEADVKVVLLKDRLDALKKRRKDAKAARSKD